MKKLLLTIVGFILGITALTAFAAGFPTTVPSAPGAGYALISTTTGAYIATSSPYFSNGITVNGGCTGCGGAYPFPLSGNATSTFTQFNGGLGVGSSGIVVNGSGAGNGTIVYPNTASNATLTLPFSDGTLCTTSSCSTFAYPFPLAGNATSTLTQFNGNASTTQLSAGLAYFGTTATSTFTSQGWLGIGSSTPFTKLGIHANNGETNRILFAIGSSTQSATSTLFSVTNTGTVAIGNIVPSALFFNAGTNSNLAVQGGISTGSFSWLTGNAGYLYFNNVGTFANGIGVSTNGIVVTPKTITSTQNYLYYDQTARLGIGTSTPFANLSIHANNGQTNTTLFAIGSSTQSATTTLISVTNTGHIMGSSTAPTLSSCGTAPSITGDDAHGYVTVGSVAATGCTITFANPYPAKPECTVTEETGSVANAFNYAVSASAIVITQTGLTSDIVHYDCRGF